MVSSHYLKFTLAVYILIKAICTKSALVWILPVYLNWDGQKAQTILFSLQKQIKLQKLQKQVWNYHGKFQNTSTDIFRCLYALI